MNAKKAALAAALALAAGLAACATATPYQPNIRGQAASGGFSEVRVDADRFRVNFAGNSLTSRETVETYLLYRAAELTVQSGYDWSYVADRQTDRDRRTYYEPDPFYGRAGWAYGGWRPYWRYYGPRYGGWRTWDPFWGDPFWADRVDVRTVERFEASAEVVMARGPKPADDPRAFDARGVLENLGPNVVRPAP